MTQNHIADMKVKSMTLIPHSYEMHMTVFAVWYNVVYLVYQGVNALYALFTTLPQPASTIDLCM